MQVLEEQVRACTRCELCRSRTHAVPGAGSYTAEVMFIGEAPGMNEDRRGLPFVGNAGQFLNEMLATIGWQRDDVYITNVVKCRPPGNRDPLPDEIEACQTYLDTQIATVDPLMIVTLGRFSMARWFKNERISRIHGKAREEEGRVIVPLYHPAAALHQPSLRAVLEEDFRKLPLILDEFRSKRGEALEDVPAPAQMKLF
jgi:DNA polymerase